MRTRDWTAAILALLAAPLWGYSWAAGGQTASPPAAQPALARSAGDDSLPPPAPAALQQADQASGVLSPVASDPRNVPNSQPDPYTAEVPFLKMPAGRTLASTSAVALDRENHVWVVDRCSSQGCANSSLAPIMEFDTQGQFLKSFGAGQLVFPHSLYIDRHDHLWIADLRAAGGKGADVLEFAQDGKLLRTLGQPGVSREGPASFTEPNAVVVASNGDIFVADGHHSEPGHTERIVKFNASGQFILQWGNYGSAAGHFIEPHCLALDNEGRLYVGDRANNRLQVFAQSGKLLRILTQFGRPSGCYIDRHDVLYVTDSASRPQDSYGYNPDFRRGIRIGSVRDGIVRAFIPDDMPNPYKYISTGGEGIWSDSSGAVYSARVTQMDVAKFVRQ